MNIKSILVAMFVASTMTGCIIVNKETSVNTQPAKLEAPIVVGSSARYIPKAVVYRMSGDAGAANVPVLVNSKGDIVSYPAPSDVKGQEPIALADGYLLDRRGISENSRFTKYTYEKYSALKQPPTVADLKAAIIPGARAIDIHILDMTTDQALADTAAVNRLIRSF